MEKSPAERSSAAGIPVPLSGLLGRRGDVASVMRQLSAARLVTLIGVGGVGKTRLAVEVAGGVGRRFTDGVHLVELAALRDGELLAQSIAAAVGLRNAAVLDAHRVLFEHLRTRKVLLVLDNCEHLVEACALLTDRLLKAAPGLRVLATSRQALRVTGEHVFAVPPLAAPSPAKAHSAAGLRRFPAVALFEQRAAAVRPGFAITSQDAAAVAELVHRLDGLPLAIELAAARMRTLTVREVLDRLDECYTLLTSGSRVAEPRQRSLQELIDWSHALCTPPEQALWARASVFSGGFDLAALESVCADDGLPRHAIVDMVDGLVEKSVLSPLEHDGRSRYHMLETIRGYGQGRLAQSGELARFRQRHRDYYLALTSQAEREWFSPAQTEWFVRLRRDHANLRAALDFCLDTPEEKAKGMALAVAPRHYWITLGSLDEGRHWLSRLLAVDASEDAATPGRAAALATYAYLGVLQGAEEQALLVLAEARTAAHREDDQSTLAWLTHHRGVVATWRHDYSGAAELFATAAAGLRRLGDVGGATECTMKQALAAASIGDRELATELCVQCESLAVAHGESWIRGMTHFVRGLAAWEDADPATAETEGLAAVRLLRPFNDWWDIAMSVELVAGGAAAAGDPWRAATLFGILHSLWTSIGGTLSAAPFLAETRRRSETSTREALGTKAFEQAYREGAALSVAEAMAYVLRERPGTAGTRANNSLRGDRPTLTRRELEVADLVAEGLSNKEIAAKLQIAQRTAENHVERIFGKLGLTSRTQLALWERDRRDTAERK